jgi:hypothetical protein
MTRVRWTGVFAFGLALCAAFALLAILAFASRPTGSVTPTAATALPPFPSRPPIRPAHRPCDLQLTGVTVIPFGEDRLVYFGLWQRAGSRSVFRWPRATVVLRVYSPRPEVVQHISFEVPLTDRFRHRSSSETTGFTVFRPHPDAASITLTLPHLGVFSLPTLIRPPR